MLPSQALRRTSAWRPLSGERINERFLALAAIRRAQHVGLSDKGNFKDPNELPPQLSPYALPAFARIGADKPTTDRSGPGCRVVRCSAERLQLRAPTTQLWTFSGLRTPPPKTRHSLRRIGSHLRLTHAGSWNGRDWELAVVPSRHAECPVSSGADVRRLSTALSSLRQLSRKQLDLSDIAHSRDIVVIRHVVSSTSPFAAADQ